MTTSAVSWVYAAGKDADAIVWIAREFKDEHWLTLKWLNQRAGSRTRFFGVAIKVLRIDGSLPAPHFRVIVAPDDWRQQELRRLSGIECRHFRQALEAKMEQAKLCVQPNGDHSNPWLSMHYKDGIRYSVDFNGEFSVAFQLESESDDSGLEWCHAASRRLEQDAACIEAKLGPLEWDRNWEGDRGSQIVSHYPFAFYDLLESSDDLHTWATEQYGLFRSAFEEYRDELLKIEPDSIHD